MTNPTSMQQIMAQGLEHYREDHPLTARQRQVCHHILDCRTETLGGMTLRCGHCHDQQILYYACRDRHCPRCQRKASEQWCARQQANLLPVTYHHLVFTLPHQLNPWIMSHPQAMYRLLYERVWSTLQAFGLKRLSGRMGMVAVLHTWGQQLNRHVHLHCLVPGGALTVEGEWKAPNGDYLFPVRALSRRFRGGFVSRLREQLSNGELDRLSDPDKNNEMLNQLMSMEWNVYSKPCLHRAASVVDYLARYSHRIALTDHRLSTITAQGTIHLDYKDYRDHNRHKTLSLSPEALIQRFLQHVLPSGFMRIRHFGILANCCRRKCLEQARKALSGVKPVKEQPDDTLTPVFTGYPCPKCQQGDLRIIAYLLPKRYGGS
ncbi:MAG: IS91 family transposase [Gammaproteobacteria bacterium]|nr:IS91 family transposase [Gammaproteobacteria bacterium]